MAGGEYPWERPLGAVPGGDGTVEFRVWAPHPERVDVRVRGADHPPELGVTHVVLMPVADFPGARGWGYDGVYILAAQSSYGGPLGLQRLVDAAHAAGLGLILDVVYNHVGASGNAALAAYGPYFTDKYSTFWGQAMNYRSEERRRRKAGRTENRAKRPQ